MKSLIQKDIKHEQKPYFLPAVDIRYTDETILIFAEMPGIAKEDMNIHLENNVLTVSADTAEENPEGYRTVLSERLPRRFKRTFQLNDSVRQDTIGAQLNNGVLVITLQKFESTKPKKIEIHV